MEGPEILKAFVLVGITTNKYVEKILTTSINPITTFVFPEAKVPEITLGVPLSILNTNEEFSDSGYFTRISIYIYAMMGF